MAGKMRSVTLTLRPLTDGDLDALFIWESDPRATRMAAFTRADPTDRAQFDAHYQMVRRDPANTLMAIEDDGQFVGTVASFMMDGERNVSYWIASERWGQGLATSALRLFLDEFEPTRPILGRVAQHNAASAKVLAKAGFTEVGSDTGFAAAVGAEIVERIYRLDR
jgi:RimJ/RimL family protein N-acetyltransferase